MNNVFDWYQFLKNRIFFKKSNISVYSEISRHKHEKPITIVKGMELHAV